MSEHVTSEALCTLRLRCEAGMTVIASEILPLIAEVERLRAVNTDLMDRIEKACQERESATTEAIQLRADLAYEKQLHKDASEEVERLKSRCDELTINGFSAQLKQLDSLRTENAMLKDAVAGYAGSGQRIQDLSDDVGLLEATNKDLSAEIERLREMLSDVANSGVQLEADPPGLSYATVQIYAELWAKLRKEFGS